MDDLGLLHAVLAAWWRVCRFSPFVLRWSTRRGRRDRRGKRSNVRGCMIIIIIIILFSHKSTFQLLDKPWSNVSSLLPPGSCLQFLSRIGYDIAYEVYVYVDGAPGAYRLFYLETRFGGQITWN